MNLEFKQHMARSKIARAECVPQIQSTAFHSLFFPLQRGFTSCLFSDTVLADMWSEENQYQHSGMYFLKRFIGGSLLFQRGIIECSTHCTFDLFNMKREMGTAMILSISLTTPRFILKPGLLAGIGWLKGWGIRSASSLPKRQSQPKLCWALAGPTKEAVDAVGPTATRFLSTLMNTKVEFTVARQGAGMKARGWVDEGALSFQEDVTEQDRVSKADVVPATHTDPSTLLLTSRR